MGRFRGLRALLVVGLALAVAVATVIVVFAPAVAQAESTSTSCQGTAGKPWSATPQGWADQCQMVNDTYDSDRQTFVLDPGSGNFLTRDQLIAKADSFAAFGFSDQFLWYAPLSQVTPLTTSEWSGCEGSYRATTLTFCDHVTAAHHSVGQDLTQSQTLDAIAYDGNWISLACGNFNLPVQLGGGDIIPAPVPTIVGMKFNDANGDKIQDDGEGGVGGVMFTLTRTSSQVGQPIGQVVDWTTSAPDGTFAFSLDKDEGPGTYVVQEVTPSGWRNTYSPPPVVVEEGEDNKTHDVSFGDIQETGLTVQPAILSAVEGQSFSRQVATFTDPDALDSVDAAASYSATIDWGDGSTSIGAITSNGGGAYTVSGTHTYADESTPTIQVSISDLDETGGSTTISYIAAVGDAALSDATGATEAATEGQAVSNVTVATFTDANPGASLNDFTSNGGSTTINWGDGSSSAGTVTQTGPGQFSVGGTHTYAALGPYTITINVVDDGGSTATATTHVIVFAYSSGGAFVIGQNESVGAPVTFWSAQWDNDNTLSGGSNAFKGFETSTPTPICPGTWTSGTGNSVMPPDTIPTYMAVIVASSVSQSGSTISGDIQKVVIVRTDPGYAPDPGHAGTGTIVATLCG